MRDVLRTKNAISRIVRVAKIVRQFNRAFHVAVQNLKVNLGPVFL